MSVQQQQRVFKRPAVWRKEALPYTAILAVKHANTLEKLRTLTPVPRLGNAKLL